jgi:hypothetical protein
MEAKRLVMTFKTSGDKKMSLSIDDLDLMLLKLR